MSKSNRLTIILNGMKYRCYNPSCKGYSPENCRWVSYKIQNNNRRSNLFISYNGKSKTLHQWCDELNLSYSKIYQRLNRLHWSVEEAFEAK